MNLQELQELNSFYHMNTYGRLPVSFVKGNGSKLWDITGKEYLDLLSGIGVTNVGHCHPKVVAAICEQASKLMHVSNLFYIEPQLLLAKKLVDISFGDKCFFANSGAEANEGAIKLARRYARIHGRDGYEIITALKSFHGRTMKTLAATGQRDKQEPFDPMPPGFKHVPLNDIDALKAEITANTCAVMLEVIQGEGGVNMCVPDYLQQVREICDEHDLLLIFDEVQTGMGRTGQMFAYQNYDVTPDVMTLAKGLGSGLPIGVMIASDKASVFNAGEHGSTFGGGPVVCAAAKATIDVLLEENLAENSKRVGSYFKQRLESLKNEFDSILEVRGLGLMLAMEFKNISQSGSAPAKELVLELLNKGIIANNIGTTIIRFLPPLLISEQEVDYAVEILRDLVVSNVA